MLLPKEHAEQLPILGGRIRRTAGQVWEHFTEGCGRSRVMKNDRRVTKKPNHVVKIHFPGRLRVTHTLDTALWVLVILLPSLQWNYIGISQRNWASNLRRYYSASSAHVEQLETELGARFHEWMPWVVFHNGPLIGPWMESVSLLNCALHSTRTITTNTTTTATTINKFRFLFGVLFRVLRLAIVILLPGEFLWTCFGPTLYYTPYACVDVWSDLKSPVVERKRTFIIMRGAREERE